MLETLTVPEPEIDILVDGADPSRRVLSLAPSPLNYITEVVSNTIDRTVYLAGFKLSAVDSHTFVKQQQKPDKGSLPDDDHHIALLVGQSLMTLHGPDHIVGRDFSVYGWATIRGKGGNLIAGSWHTHPINSVAVTQFRSDCEQTEFVDEAWQNPLMEQSEVDQELIKASQKLRNGHNLSSHQVELLNGGGSINDHIVRGAPGNTSVFGPNALHRTPATHGALRTGFVFFAIDGTKLQQKVI